MKNLAKIDKEIMSLRYRNYGRSLSERPRSDGDISAYHSDRMYNTLKKKMHKTR